MIRIPIRSGATSVNASVSVVMNDSLNLTKGACNPAPPFLRAECLVKAWITLSVGLSLWDNTSATSTTPTSSNGGNVATSLQFATSCLRGNCTPSLKLVTAGRGGESAGFNVSGFNSTHQYSLIAAVFAEVGVTLYSHHATLTGAFAQATLNEAGVSGRIVLHPIVES